MKKIITVLFLLISISSFSQTEYYTTDGKNRITKKEAEKILSAQVEKMSKVMGKKLYGTLTVENTETKNVTRPEIRLHNFK